MEKRAMAPQPACRHACISRHITILASCARPTAQGCPSTRPLLGLRRTGWAPRLLLFRVPSLEPAPSHPPPSGIRAVELSAVGLSRVHFCLCVFFPSAIHPPRPPGCFWPAGGIFHAFPCASRDNLQRNMDAAAFTRKVLAGGRMREQQSRWR